MTVKDYRELIVWQKAMDLVEAIYRTHRSVSKGGTLWTDKPNASRRRLHSIEYRRRTSDATRLATILHFLGMAYGSVKEVETQVLIAERLRYIDSSQSEPIGADNHRESHD